MAPATKMPKFQTNKCNLSSYLRYYRKNLKAKIAKKAIINNKKKKKMRKDWIRLRRKIVALILNCKKNPVF